MTVDTARPVRILLVDDDEVDAELTRARLQAARITAELHIASSGDRALAYLRSQDSRQHAARSSSTPDLVLLDVDMPGMNGIETLQAIKSDSRLKHIPVLMLSGSTQAEDISRSYAGQALAYLAKPLHVESFRSVLRGLQASVSSCRLQVTGPSVG